MLKTSPPILQKNMLKTFLHYGFHFILFPCVAYIIWEYSNKKGGKALLFVLLSMFVDLDHLLADPIFDPNRLSIGFHPLHSYPMIIVYFLGILFPYKRFNLWWGFRPLCFGLLFHMLTDYLDFYIF